jgi:hypothetical protein
LHSGNASRRVFRKLAGSSVVNALGAGVNLLTTVVIVRLCGTTAYSEYMLDLAIVSIAMVVFEVVPSSYVVFKAQDDAAWYRALAAQMVANVGLVVAVVAAIALSGRAFFSFTNWITLYAASMAVKRFVDLRLQAHGRVIELFGLGPGGVRHARPDGAFPRVRRSHRCQCGVVIPCSIQCRGAVLVPRIPP